MSKAIVQTTGQFMLINGDIEIKPLKPTLVQQDSFINHNIANGKLRLLLDDVGDDTRQADVEFLLAPKPVVKAKPVAETKPTAASKAKGK